MGCAPLSGLFRPSSLALVGVSQRGLGRLVLDHTLDADFQGEVFVVHPSRPVIAGIETHPEPSSLPHPPDLVIVAVPRAAVLEVVREFAELGTRYAVVVTAGFGESGVEGRLAQRELLSTSKVLGIRVLGPNCMGVINTDPTVCLHASFGVSPALPGKIALVTQSGSVGDYFLYHGRRLGAGISTLVSFGNESDIQASELITAAAEDERTSAIACYIEHPARPKDLLDAISQACRVKPVVVLRGGRTALGSTAATSHTGRILERSAHVAVDTLLEGAGAQLVENLEELAVVSSALARHPRVYVNKIALLTNAGGPGVLAMDSLVERSVDVLDAGQALTAVEKDTLPPIASHDGPVIDLTASATADDFLHALDVVERRADALLCVIMSPEGTDPRPIVSGVAERWRGPLFFSLLAEGETTRGAWDHALSCGASVVREPALAVRAIQAVVTQSRALGSDRRGPPSRAVIPREALRQLDALCHSGSDVARLSDALRFAKTLGVPTIEWRDVNSTRSAVNAAAQLGGPVMVKLDAAGVIHKTEKQLVLGPLQSPAEVEEAAAMLFASPEAQSDPTARVVVQRHCVGVELIIGVACQGRWGRALIVGHGGIFAEILAEPVMFPCSVSTKQLDQGLDSLVGARILGEYRGLPAVPKAPIISTASAFSNLALEAPIIYEIEANPFIAVRGEEGLSGVADMRVVVRRDIDNEERQRRTDERGTDSRISQ